MDKQIDPVVPLVHQADFRDYQFRESFPLHSIGQLKYWYLAFVNLFHREAFRLFLQEQNIEWMALDAQGQNEAVALFADSLRPKVSERECAGCKKTFEAPVGERAHTCPACVEAIQKGEKPKFTDAKQVILVRKDLQMPAGKMAAQVAHASMACILNMGTWDEDEWGDRRFKIGLPYNEECDAVHDWMTKSFPKITLEVKNEAQLKRYYDEAVAAGLPASWIVDAGRTVFEGVPTPTCVGIGPASREQIDAITKRLRVYQ